MGWQIKMVAGISKECKDCDFSCGFVQNAVVTEQECDIEPALSIKWENKWTFCGANLKQALFHLHMAQNRAEWTHFRDYFL